MILPVNHPPIAEAGPDRLACVGESIDFDGGKSTDRDGQIVRYDWSFGDETDALGAKASHVFTKPGNYQIKLMVTDDSDSRQCGTGTDEAVLRINAPPVAVAKEHKTLYTGGAHDAVLFDARGSFDGDDDALLHLWNFGDGNTKAGARVFHAYAKPGQYTVRLTVRDGTSLTCGEDVAEFTVNVLDRAAMGNDAQQ